MDIYTLIFCHVLSAILCIILAKAKGRSPLVWLLLALLSGLLPLFILLLLNPAQKPTTEESEP